MSDWGGGGGETSFKAIRLVHAVNKGQLFDSPITHLIVAGNRKEKRGMKELWKAPHAPNFDQRSGVVEKVLL